jgi:hypothetical protein
MTLMAIAGFKSVPVPVTSTISLDSKDLEVGMALDITGSMGQSIGGVRKIDGLKVAFERFANTLIPDSPGLISRKVRLGVAPYSASVDLGSYAKSATNFRSTDGCVIERANATYTDVAPSSGNYFKVKADITGPNNYICPTSTVMPLTDNKTALINHVKSFRENGSTAGHLGIQWGWNLVSENYAGFWGGSSAPDTYAKTKGTKPKLLKAVILMTDGQFNTQYNSATSDVQAVALCDAMKKEGVLVLTIGFGLGTSPLELAAKKTLQDCASPGPQFFVDAANSHQLDTALQGFAQTLTQLRIAQ